ncbi:MAG TPA: tetratricopeptide repeat protein, partial [Gallionella sp.]|nr:tetratricopeptide repeat protein [Gallionella sp.]
AIELKPDFAQAHNNLGSALKDLVRFDEAEASYRKAVELDPDFAEAHNNLGIALKEIGRLDEARACYQRALELKPDFVEAYNNLGTALLDMGQFDTALDSFRKAVELKPDHAGSHNNLGFALLLTGRFSEGWKEYWWRIRPQERSSFRDRPLPDDKSPARGPVKPLPSNLHGTRLALLTDQQGLGDDIFFLRFARELKDRGAWLGYAGEPRIVAFLRRMKWFDAVAENREEIGDVDISLLAGDLPLALGMVAEADIPPPIPLEVLPEKRQEIALRLESRRDAKLPLIGITWRGGGDKNGRRMVREIPIELLAATLREIEATFVIVQRNPEPGEIAAFEKVLGRPVLDFSEVNNDLEGMLALMEQLDDYIGVDNTNMHLRASVGKTARILVPHLQDFRCMAKGDRSPWFPGFTLYRRTTDDGWSSALEELKHHIM